MCLLTVFLISKHNWILSTKSTWREFVIKKESQAYESVLNSYLREIESLTREISQLRKINDSLNKEKKTNFVEKNVAKDAAETNICKIINEIEVNKIGEVESDLVASDYTKKGEIEFDSLLRILKKFNVSLAGYEIQNVFNNFKRSSVNSINYFDFLAVLKMKAPTAYVFQPDPAYVQDMEKKIIEYEVKLKRKDELINALEGKIDTIDYEKMALQKEFLDEKANLIRELHKAERDKDEAVKRMTSWEIGGNQTAVDVKKLKEKLKQTEMLHKDKVCELENKMYDLTQDRLEKQQVAKLEDRLNATGKERDALKVSVTELKGKIKDLEEKQALIVEKYKRKIKKMKLIEKPAETVILTSKDDPYERIKEKLEKIETTQKAGEDYYKRLSVEAQNEVLAKEFERMKHGFKKERKQYEKALKAKNNELVQLKEQFELIITEIDSMKKKR